MLPAPWCSVGRARSACLQCRAGDLQHAHEAGVAAVAGLQGKGVAGGLSRAGGGAFPRHVPALGLGAQPAPLLGSDGRAGVHCCGDLTHGKRTSCFTENSK